MSDYDDFVRGQATGYGNNFWSHYGAMERAREERREAERRAREARAQRERWAAERGGVSGTVTAPPPTPAEPGLLDQWFDRLDAWAEKLPRWVNLVFVIAGVLAGTLGGAAMGMEGGMLLLAAFGGAVLGASVIPMLVGGIKIVLGLALLALFAGGLYLAVMLVAQLGGG